MTYGAGGITRDTTVQITGRIARETSMRAMGHLTCVGHTRAELATILESYRAAGVRNILALRGDPPGRARAPRGRRPRAGLTYAVELVELVRSSAGSRSGSRRSPRATRRPSRSSTTRRCCVAKARAGAEFAVSQLFFRPQDYFELVERVRAHGVDIPILPGIMPILNLRSVARMAELSGADIPAEVMARFDGVSEPADVRTVGIEIATELCEALLAGGAPGLHFYTLNRSRATLEIFEALQITV